MPLERPLAGRVVLVTGASRRIGIGAGVARRLAADGASLLLHGFSPHDDERPGLADPGGGAALVRELRAAGTAVKHVEADLADPDAPAALVAAARTAFGRLAVHLAGRAITVNCIDPGPTDTGYADPAARAAVVERHPGGRWSTPGDTAKLIAWLLSDEADWVTGQVIASDGGWSAAG